MAEYPFKNGGRYRFIFKGQEKSVATLSTYRVEVLDSDSKSDNQIWIATRNEVTHELRFKNVGNNHFLGRDGGDTKLKADSSTPGEKQNFRFTTFKTGWKLSLNDDGVWKAIGVQSNQILWLDEVEKDVTITIFEIYDIGN